MPMEIMTPKIELSVNYKYILVGLGVVGALLGAGVLLRGLERICLKHPESMTLRYLYVCVSFLVVSGFFILLMSGDLERTLGIERSVWTFFPLLFSVVYLAIRGTRFLGRLDEILEGLHEKKAKQSQ